MSLARTQAVVIGRRALGEHDRLVHFYTRGFGRLSGVVRGARRPRARLGPALEPFALGDLLFFDPARSDLVRVDQFDLLHPFLRVREDLLRLGRGAWMVECLARLTAERDPQPALFGHLVRSLRALEQAPEPARVALCFALRAVDLLGHRPRLDRCVACGRPWPFPGATLDPAAGGLLCAGCRTAPDALAVSGGAVGALKRLRSLGWEEALRLPLAGALAGELELLTEGLMARLMGAVPRSARFLAQTRRGIPLGPAAPDAAAPPRDGRARPPGGRG